MINEQIKGPQNLLSDNEIKENVPCGRFSNQGQNLSTDGNACSNGNSKNMC